MKKVYKKRPTDVTSPSRRRGTVEYFCATTWSSINQRTVNGSHPSWNHPEISRYLKKGIRLEMTHQEWKIFCSCYGWLIDVIYKAGETPSIERKNPEGPYSLDNIEIITLTENIKRQHGVTSYGNLLIAKRKEVVCLETGEIFPSVTAAATFFNLSVSSVAGQCHRNPLKLRKFRRAKNHFCFFEELRNADFLCPGF